MQAPRGLLNRFLEHWHDEQFAGPEDTVLLAVSGGPDSMAMLSLFYEAKIPIAAAHCNFNLRGAASDADEHLVLDWCMERGILCHARVFNTRKYAETEKLSIQEAARDIRYEYLNALCEEFNYACIATAHHREDNAETILMRIFQGAGINGLQGIPLKNKRVIRPLLFAAQKSLQVYLADRQIPFRIDASNNSDAYLRNRLRRHTLPALKKEFPDAIDQLNALAEKMQDAAWLYQDAVRTQLAALTATEESAGGQLFSIEKSVRHPARKTLIYEWLKSYGFTAHQTDEVLYLLEAPVGKKVLSATHAVIREPEHLHLSRLEAPSMESHLIPAIPAIIVTSDAVFHFSETTLPQNLNAGSDAVYLDLGKIKWPLTLRHWQTGDEFCPLGMQGKTKKLSDFFVDQKFSRREKEKVWILESKGRIVWIAGHRPDDRFSITDATARVLLVRMEKQNPEG